MIEPYGSANVRENYREVDIDVAPCWRYLSTLLLRESIVLFPNTAT